MGKVLRCYEAGEDCDFVACGRTEEEVLKKAVDHAKSKHNVRKITREYIKKLHEVIHNEYKSSKYRPSSTDHPRV